jgi:hypothetical protein
MACSKGNLSANSAKALTFRIIKDGEFSQSIRPEWGEEISATADDLLYRTEANRAENKKNTKENADSECDDSGLLLDYLRSHGESSWPTIVNELKNKCTEHTLRQARSKLLHDRVILQHKIGASVYLRLNRDFEF